MIVAERLCVLQGTVGRTETCPRERCPFWEEGGAVIDAGCFLERVLPVEDWTPELAHRWLRIRSRVAGGAGDARRLFYLLPPAAD